MEHKQPRLLRADEIETRVNQFVEGRFLSLLLYKTARVDMDVLDETYGPENWQNYYTEVKGVLYCTIVVNGVAKMDCGTESNTEAQKGEASDAFKRAGTRWMIGRELYSAPKIFIDASKFQTKEVRGKIVPADSFAVSQIEYDANRKISMLQIVNTRDDSIVFQWRKQTNIKCADCGIVIVDPFIADGTMKAYGRHLCTSCGMKEKLRAQAAQK